MSSSRIPPTRITVVHGDVRESKFPVLVGHYVCDGLTSVERTLSTQLSGALLEAHATANYPAQVGDAQVFLLAKAAPPGAIVVGLGHYGELTADQITQTAANGLVHYSGKCKEDCISVGAVLMGAETQPLLDEYAIVGALVDAVDRARGLLAQQEPPRSIALLEIIEARADRALNARLALDEVLESRWPPGKIAPVFANGPLDERFGGYPAPLGARRRPWHFQVAISRSEPRGTLSFRTTTDRARALCTGRFIPDQDLGALASAATDTARAEAGDALSQRVLPPELARRIRLGADFTLILDAEAARVPWELLQPAAEGAAAPDLAAPPIAAPPSAAPPSPTPPFAARSGLIRQFSSPEEHVREKVPHRRIKKALIIAAPTEVARLEHAAAEGEQVHQLIAAAGLDTKPLIRSNQRQIEAALKEPYDLLHIVTHGVRDLERRGWGLQIGHERKLTVKELVDPEVAPFLFLNCCDSGAFGRIAPALPPEMASGLAEALILAGARALVVAGWPVSDQPARTFAGAFYEAMLQGRPLIEAALRARARTFHAHPNDSTWGAYQIYGDPEFRLVEPSDVKRPLENLVNKRQLFDALRVIRVRARSGDVNGLVKEIDALARDGLERWPCGEVFTALGAAYADIQESVPAVHYYSEALPYSDTPLRAIEQIASLEIRMGYPNDPASIESAIRRLGSLGPSSERMALLGSAKKRLAAMAEVRGQQDEFLREALRHYRRAAHLAKQANQRRNAHTHRNDPVLDPYPERNAFELALACGRRPNIRRLCAWEAAAGELPDAWALLHGAGAMACRYYAGLCELSDVGDAYSKAFSVNAAPRYRETVRAHYRLVKKFPRILEKAAQIESVI